MSSLESAGHTPGHPLNEGPQVADVLQRYGSCLELIPADPHFQDISVGLYAKDGVYTVWSFSRKAGVEDRLKQIRDQMVVLGGLAPVESSPIQVSFPCGNPHLRPLKFLLAQAVGKSPDYTAAQDSSDQRSTPTRRGTKSDLSIKDTKSSLILNVSGEEQDDRYVYHVSAEGDAANAPLRLRAVVTGFVRYGEMEKVGDTVVTFPCGQRHDDLIRIVLPYSRNVFAVENLMEEEALRGQMTTGTLGFTPTV